MQFMTVVQFMTLVSWCARGSLLVLSWYARVGGVVRCGAVQLVRYGPPIIGYVRIRDHVRA